MDYIKNIRKKIGHDPIFMPTAAAIIYQDGKILLQKRKDNGFWAIHGGAMELGETIDECLVREVKEEIGLVPKTYRFFKNYSGRDFMYQYPNKDIVYIVEHVYIIETFDGNIAIDESEVMDCKWFSIHDIPWNELMPHNKIIIKDYISQISK
ncbi:MAG TPA: NUDIX hydrolase [Acholeplasma sp.]|nr:NUDIX hydrolase [Acholeplasma sp.]